MLSAEYSFDLTGNFLAACDKNTGKGYQPSKPSFNSYLNFTYEGEITITMQIHGDQLVSHSPNEWRELVTKDKRIYLNDNDGTAAVNGCGCIYSKDNNLNFVVDGSLGVILTVSIPKTDAVIELINEIADALEKPTNFIT